MLMLLSLPNICFRETNTLVELIPFSSAQKIWIEACYNSYSKEMKLSLRSEDNSIYTHFYWQFWINLAKGCLSEYDEAQRNLGMPVLNDRSVTNVNLSLEMMPVKPSFTKYLEISETMHYWVGWPVFGAKLCRFEFDEWLNLRIGKEENEEYLDESVEIIESEISSINSWKCFQSS